MESTFFMVSVSQRCALYPIIRNWDHTSLSQIFPFCQGPCFSKEKQKVFQSIPHPIIPAAFKCFVYSKLQQTKFKKKKYIQMRNHCKFSYFHYKFTRNTNPFSIVTSLSWPLVKLLGHLQRKHVASTTSCQAAAILAALASELPNSQWVFLQ